ncbi:hypothetical protein BOTBODRAFT_390176 [Botryobasidium botryosum FD-172 SS1]|uniref:Uncharacterized protein n=1 Tax=Botryobasidium botryosum (strain FD-172 SS1) TaxID=930990 RepID=A0A067MX58_BOTB1|nr:hypothetical protein BOTBODRAFT_390176 [Botryobasidium botryosum FD-172 SS1]
MLVAYKVEALVLSHVGLDCGGRPPERIILPALNLSLYFVSCLLSRYIFTSLDAPSLHSLKAMFQNHRAMDELRSFLLQHGPSIRVFQIYEIHTGTIDFLGALPNLDVLGIISANAGPPLRHIASYIARPGLISPPLSAIDINVGEFDSSAIQPLKQILGTASLRSLSVRGESGYSEGEEEKRDKAWSCERVKTVAVWDIRCGDDPRTRCFGSPYFETHPGIFGGGTNWSD